MIVLPSIEYLFAAIFVAMAMLVAHLAMQLWYPNTGRLWRHFWGTFILWLGFLVWQALDGDWVIAFWQGVLALIGGLSVIGAYRVTDRTKEQRRTEAEARKGRKLMDHESRLE